LAPRELPRLKEEAKYSPLTAIYSPLGVCAGTE